MLCNVSLHIECRIVVCVSVPEASTVLHMSVVPTYYCAAAAAVTDITTSRQLSYETIQKLIYPILQLLRLLLIILLLYLCFYNDFLKHQIVVCLLLSLILS